MIDEIITAIRIPVPARWHKNNLPKIFATCIKVCHCWLCSDAFPDGKTNIAFTGVSDNAFRDSVQKMLYQEKQLNDASIAAAVNAAVQDVSI